MLHYKFVDRAIAMFFFTFTHLPSSDVAVLLLSPFSPHLHQGYTLTLPSKQSFGMA